MGHGLGVLLLLLPLQEHFPLLGPPSVIKLKESPVVFALKKLLAIFLELLEFFHSEALLLIFLPQLLVLLHQIEPLVRPLAPLFDLFDLRCKLLNALVGFLNLRLLLGQLARKALLLREAGELLDL